ncbi:transcriptional regulator SlyA [compost metagenome]
MDRLVQKDLVRRETNPKDRRARELYLTGKGEETLKEIRPIVWHMQSLLLEGLDAGEREVFVALLRKAADAGNEMSRAPLRLS